MATFDSEKFSYIFSSESVSEGHPDKVADYVADSILDAHITQDPHAHVACEVLVKEGNLILAGEISSQATVDAAAVARQAVREIGYTDPEQTFSADRIAIQTLLTEQAREIGNAVNRLGSENIEQGAGDQGIMFGYATDETPELMPLPVWLAHRLVERQAELRRTGELPWLRPDAKSQVTLRYEGRRPAAVERVVLSTQHAPEVDNETIRREVIRRIIEPAIPDSLRDKAIRYLVNPTGRFEIGGPNGDTGLTGRKIIVDTYGGSCPHGGGAFSGKDPTKVDRSAAYIARNVAKTIVASGLASRCTLQLSYAIGVAEPLSVYLDLHGTGVVDEGRLEDAIREEFDLTPAGIIRELRLLRPIYRKTAAYGHFGRSLPEFTWEQTSRGTSLRERVLGGG